MASKGSVSQQTENKLANPVDSQMLEKALEGLSSATFHEIGIDYHLHKSKRSLQLLGNKDAAKVIASRHEWFGYEFKDLIYLSSVEISTEGFGDYDEFELSYIDSLLQTEKIITAKPFEGKVKFAVGKFVGGFGFRPPSKYWVSPKLISIDSYGMTTLELNTFVDQFVQVANIRDRVMRECQMHVEQATEADKQKSSLEANVFEIESNLEAVGAKINIGITNS